LVLVKTSSTRIEHDDETDGSKPEALDGKRHCGSGGQFHETTTDAKENDSNEDSSNAQSQLSARRVPWSSRL
jgi:hypothetical protein